MNTLLTRKFFCTYNPISKDMGNRANKIARNHVKSSAKLFFFFLKGKHAHFICIDKENHISS